MKKITLRNLRNIRLELGLSQSKLSQLADVDRGTISNVERGMGVSPKTVRKIEGALFELKSEKQLSPNQVAAIAAFSAIVIAALDDPDDPGPR